MRKFLVNNQIRAEKIRLIDESGKQLGIFSLEEALKIAKERNLDLIQVTEKVEPPVCKMGDYGKYLYQVQKKEKKERGGQVKGIRLSYNISLHDLETRVDQAEKFLQKGDKIKVELILRGREKGLSDFGKEKIKNFLELLENKIPIKIEQDLKRTPGGFIMIITKK